MVTKNSQASYETTRINHSLVKKSFLNRKKFTESSMSQFWHANWAEDSFKPVMLGNWQVPNWHPKWPCKRHCVTTIFLADKTGRLLPGQPRSKRSPWGDFKGTWELPLKIDRRLAERLSAPPKYKIAAWQAHKKRYEGPCGINPVSSNNNKTRNTTNAQKSGKSSSGTKKKTEKTIPAKKSAGPNTKRTEKDSTVNKKPADEKTKLAERKAPTAIPKKRIKEPKDKGKSVAGEPAKDLEIIAKEPEDTKDIEPDSVKDEKEVVKERPKKGLEQETKRDRRIKCPCVKNMFLPGERSRRNICTIHQRLRV